TFGVNIVSSGGINLTSSTISNNTDYAIGTDVNTQLQGLTGLTITGNGSGSKNGVGYRGGANIITTNEVWHVGPIWFVIASVTVGNGTSGTLSIDAGTTVKFASATGITTSGASATLTANGTSANPIMFTTSSATPAPGQWNYLSIGGSSQLSYATISYAGQSASVPAALNFNGGSPTA